ncbi:MAG: hypothetical protein RIT45_189, partial [Pseudomonadota bacterium]
MHSMTRWTLVALALWLVAGCSGGDEVVVGPSSGLDSQLGGDGTIGGGKDATGGGKDAAGGGQDGKGETDAGETDAVVDPDVGLDTSVPDTIEPDTIDPDTTPDGIEPDAVPDVFDDAAD